MVAERRIVEGHKWEWDYDPPYDTHSVRCECGWLGVGTVTEVDEALDDHLEEAEAE